MNGIDPEILLILVGLLVGTAEAIRRVLVKRFEAKTQAMLAQQKALIEKDLEKEKARIKIMQQELEAKLEAQRDEREFQQTVERQTLEFQKLQASWGADGTMELLRQMIDFVQTTVIGQDEQILKEIGRFNQTLARNTDGIDRLSKDNTANTRLLAGSIDGLGEKLREDESG